MALSEGAEQSLNWALEKAGKQGATIWGFISENDGAELTTFSNFQDHTAEIEMILHNTNAALKTLLQMVESKAKHSEA